MTYLAHNQSTTLLHTGPWKRTWLTAASVILLALCSQLQSSSFCEMVTSCLCWLSSSQTLCPPFLIQSGKSHHSRREKWRHHNQLAPCPSTVFSRSGVLVGCAQKHSLSPDRCCCLKKMCQWCSHRLESFGLTVCHIWSISAIMAIFLCKVNYSQWCNVLH